jgi:hypothetical protein
MDEGGIAMLLRAVEQMLVLIAIALLVVIFVQNLVANPALLDLIAPIVAGVGFVLWLVFRSPCEQH